MQKTAKKLKRKLKKMQVYINTVKASKKAVETLLSDIKNDRSKKIIITTTKKNNIAITTLF